jgi:hypothetical protein
MTAPPDESTLETRFKTLMLSPLRAGLIRFLHSRQHKWFDIESLMQTFGRLRLDVENCMRELVMGGVVERASGAPPRFRASLPDDAEPRNLVVDFLEQRAADIPLLAHSLLARYCTSNGIPLDSKILDSAALDLLSTYHWPGNIRELESTVSRAALSSPQ